MVIPECHKEKGCVEGMNRNAVRLGYFLAITLLLSALLYFFASNWPALGRWENIGVSAAVLTLFYLFSYLVSLVLRRQSFISNWLLVAGGLAFGISIALLGQIYNSHADSYLLFAVWFVPNLLFAFLTRYQPFYVISYVLAHLAIGFYLNPSAIRVSWEAEWWFLFYWIIALINMALFWLTFTKRLYSPAIHYLSFFVFSTALFLSSFEGVYGPLPELLYMLVGAGLFFTFLKWLPSRGFLLVTSAYVAIFLLGNFFWYALIYFSEGFFVIGLLIAGGLVWGTAAAAKWLKQDERLASSLWFRFFREAFTVLVTTVASLIGTISISGLLLLVATDVETVAYFLFFLSIIGFLLPVVFSQKMDATVRYTLLTMGFLLGAASTLYLDQPLWLLFLAALIGVWTMLRSIPGRLLTQLAFLIVLYVKLERMFWSEEIGLSVIFLLQMAMYLAPRLDSALRSSSLCYALLTLLGLTETEMGVAFSVAANLAFFALSTFLLYRTLHKGRKWDFGIALGFWFAFLLMKYYDFFWSLLHKSFSLLLLSALFFLASYWLDRQNKEEQPAQTAPLIVRKKLVLLPVILLQFAVVGYQVWNSETILAEGTLIKLELLPVDPRSLLQGDYVQLNYSISSLDGELPPGKKIRVVLRKKEQGVHEFSGYYEVEGVWNQPYQAKPDDVIINGRVYGWNDVEYGIESYFVPEGTGLEVEEKAKYALVRVGKNGDAILERLAEE